MNIFGVVHRISSLWRDLSEVRHGRSKIALVYGLTSIIWAALFNVGLYRSMIDMSIQWNGILRQNYILNRYVLH